MSKHIYTEEDINKLSGNKYVVCCSDKSITFSTEFKKLAVHQYNEEGLVPREIFEQAGFDLQIIAKDTPKECLGRWRSIVDRKGTMGLTETRGRNSSRAKTKNMSDKERMEYLEAKVAYLEAENDFLAKLRAQRRAE